MFCSNCGNQIDSDSKVCGHCGVSILGDTNPVQVSNNSNTNNEDIPTFSPVHSIILLIFCILCCGGVVGVIFAALSLVEGDKVNKYVKSGNIEEARIAKKKATNWIKATYITCAVVTALVLLYCLISFLAVA